jgi:hypothetical protein
LSKKRSASDVKELDLLDHMLTAPVDLLEQKGILTHKEWEKKIKEKIKERMSLVDFRDLK